MKNKLLAIIAVALSVGPISALSEQVQSSTTVNLTLRTCISGTSVCDDVSPAINTYAGFPGDQTAQADVDDEGFGTASGYAELAGDTIGIMTATATSLAGKRTGGNSGTLRRYTNMSPVPATLTFNAVLSYDQVVPPENADFPIKSLALANLFIFSTNDEFIEAGDTELSNWQATWLQNFCVGCNTPPSSAVPIVFAEFGDDSNVTGAGTITRSLSAEVLPGHSVWFRTQLQSLAANGAVVNATLDTNITSNVYACAGFEPPAHGDLVVRKKNRVVPLRMSLLDVDGMNVSDIAAPVVNVSYTSVAGAVTSLTDELDYVGKGDDGNKFQYNGSNWAFNLDTKELAAGTYTLTAVAGDPAYVISPTCETTVTIQ